MRKFLELQRYLAPESLEEALQLLRQEGPGARVLAGGTDLFVAMKEKGLRAECLVDIKRISELRGIGMAEDGRLRIGAATTLHEIERSETVKRVHPLLSEAVGTIGSFQVRNRGTIGGNLANASPAADSAPALLVSDAELELVSAGGVRIVPVEAFFRGPGQSVLEEDEVLKCVFVPVPPPGMCSAYLKFGVRRAMEISIVSVAVSLVLDEGGVCRRARVALGSVAPTPLRARRAEAVLLGRIERERLEEAAEEAVAEAKPITDLRASAEYRRHIVRVLVKRAVREAISRYGVAAGEGA